MLKMSEGQREYDKKLLHVEYWNSVFSGRSVCSLTSDEIISNTPSHWLSSSKKSPKRQKLTNATKNRYIATIRRILSIAQDLDWIVKAPKLSNLPEPAVNFRWITREEAQKLLGALTADWMRDACQFALATGARANEILSLTWDKVDIDRELAWVTNDLAKNSKARPLPLNREAVEVLERRRWLKHEYCFTRDSGLRIRQISKPMLDNAVKAIGIKPMTFHDLRHTWASWHAQSGTPLMILKEMGGWKTLSMVQKYAHLNAGHLANYAHVTEVKTHFCHTDENRKNLAA